MEYHLHSAEYDLLESLSYMMYFARQVRAQISKLTRTSGIQGVQIPRICDGLDAYSALEAHSHTMELLGREIAKDTLVYRDDPEQYNELLERWDYGVRLTLFESIDLLRTSISRAKRQSWEVYNTKRELKLNGRSFGGMIGWKLNELLYFANELARAKAGKGLAGAVHRAKFLFCVPPIPRNLSAASRDLILWRDENCCFLCGDTRDLHVHHINCERVDNRASNLVTVCQLCHKDLHEQTYRGKPSKRSGCDESELRRRVKHRFYQGRGRAQLELAVS